MTATREAIIYSFISTRPPGSVRASHRQYVLLTASKSIPYPTTSAEAKEKVTKSKGKRSQAGGRPVEARDAVRPSLILVYLDHQFFMVDNPRIDGTEETEGEGTATEGAHPHNKSHT